MGVISWLAEKLGTRTPPPEVVLKRVYAAGVPSRNNAGFSQGGTRNMDAELRQTLRNMRNHSRNLAQNNDYYKRYVNMVVKNVVGPKGFSFKVMAKNSGGKLDDTANRVIRDAFLDWCRRGNCDVTGKLSFTDCQRLFMRTVPTDGEILVRKVRSFNNRHGFAIQFIEADHLDELLNTVLPNGNEIRMGVEFDPWDRPVAYHILKKHPGDYALAHSGLRYEVIPAADIIHGMSSDRPRQSRGVPWGHAAMTRLNNIGGYEDAAIINARIGASKMGFFEKSVDADPSYNNGDDTDAQGNVITEAEPGTFEELPVGWTFKEFNPSYPAQEFDPFMKRSLKGISAGLDVAYHKLASDLEGVNYSSARAGELDERDTWEVWQDWFADIFLNDVFGAWLEVQLLAGRLLLPAGSALPISKFDKFNAPAWRARSWAWVDPVKDMVASEKELANRLTSRSRICDENGEDLETIFMEIKAERDLAKKYGIELIDPLPSGAKLTVTAADTNVNPTGEPSNGNQDGNSDT